MSHLERRELSYRPILLQLCENENELLQQCSPTSRCRVVRFTPSQLYSKQKGSIS